MNYKKKSIVIFSVFSVLILMVIIASHLAIGNGTKEKKSAKSFINLLSSNDLIDEPEDMKDIKSTKKSDPSRNREYYSVTIGNYAIDIDAQYNVIGFTHNKSIANNVNISVDNAKDIAEGYLNIIYDGDCKFKEVVKEEEAQLTPYYSLLFTKYKDGYPYYNYNISLMINKETGKLEGFSNSSIDKEPKEIVVNINKDDAKEIAIAAFSKLYSSTELAEDIVEAYAEDKENTELELCYVVMLKGLDENNKEVKMKYFVSTETGDIINFEKSNVTNTTT